MYLLADRIHEKLVTSVALRRVFERMGISRREIYFYYVFFNSIFFFLLPYIRKALHIIVMNVLSSHNDFKCTLKFLIDILEKLRAWETDVMLGSVHYNSWKNDTRLIIQNVNVKNFYCILTDIIQVFKVRAQDTFIPARGILTKSRQTGGFGDDF